MKALIVVDMQKDFMSGGALPTQGADALVSIINGLMESYPVVVATKDWHPQNHVSFEEWPVHCVQGTKGAEFASGLNVKRLDMVFEKGADSQKEAYSGFSGTGLEQFLKERQIHEITIVGVTTDYCILESVLEAIKLGFDVTVIRKACRAMEDEEKAFDMMKNLGAKVV